jgi:hypothetical protein
MDTARRSPGRPPVRAACAVLAVAGIEDLKTTPASTTMGLGQNFAGHWTPGVKLQVPQMSHPSSWRGARIHTIGHPSRTFEALVTLLRAFNISGLADIRPRPARGTTLSSTA